MQVVGWKKQTILPLTLGSQSKCQAFYLRINSHPQTGQMCFGVTAAHVDAFGCANFFHPSSSSLDTVRDSPRESRRSWEGLVMKCEAGKERAAHWAGSETEAEARQSHTLSASLSASSSEWSEEIWENDRDWEESDVQSIGQRGKMMNRIGKIKLQCLLVKEKNEDTKNKLENLLFVQLLWRVPLWAPLCGPADTEPHSASPTHTHTHTHKHVSYSKRLNYQETFCTHISAINHDCILLILRPRGRQQKRRKGGPWLGKLG